MDQLKQHKFIVFCNDHYNPLGLVRSLGETGIKSDCIIITPNPILFSHSKYVNQLIKVRDRMEGLDYIVSHYSNEKLKPFILTGDDKTIELLNRNYVALDDKFYFYNAGGTRIDELMNKDIISSLAEEAGLSVLPREVVNHGDLPTTLQYPVMTKSIMSIVGGGKDDSFICETEEDLKSIYPRIKAHKVLIQQYIKKKTEWNFEGFSVKQGQEIYIPFVIKHCRFTDKSFGYYMTVEPFVDEYLREKLYKLIRSTHFEGIFEIEFLESQEGQLYFLEVNFRSSPWAFALTSGNVNVPYLWAKAMLSGGIDYASIHPQQTMFTAIDEILDFANSVKSRKISFFKWMKQVIKSQRKYYFTKDDPKPAIYAYWRYLKKSLKKHVIHSHR